MTKDVKAIQIGDKIILMIDGKRSTVSRKVAPEAFDQAVALIKEGKKEELASMFSGVNEKIADYAKGIFSIKGNQVYAVGETEPAPKLVARKMFEMMNLNLSPEPLSFLNKKMHRNGKGVAAGMEMFAKLDNIPMTTRGNLVLKVAIKDFEMDELLTRYGSVVGSPKNTNNSNSAYDLPVTDFEDDDNFIYVLIDPSDIQAFYHNVIRVNRYKILCNFEFKPSPVIEVPLEELYDISFDIWKEHREKQIVAK